MKKIHALWGLTALALLASCSSQSTAEKEVDKEVAQEQPATSRPEFLEASREILFEADTLSPEQRQKLRKLYGQSMKKSDDIRMELSKNQLVLMKSLVNPKAKEEEIDVLKNRIVKLEQQRTKNFLSALDEARRILGRTSTDDERFYRAFLMDPVKPGIMP